jgi:putative zinc finger/helix-turn-helix YgiT family protein
MKNNKNDVCMMCMEEHPVNIVKSQATNIYKGQEIQYEVKRCYCEKTDEYYIPEELIKNNDIAMKDAYREKQDLLLSDDIVTIRKMYQISQKDLSRILGWSESTITRYETHQVQDIAHDSILRKIKEDPKWLLNFLEKNKDYLSEKSYYKIKKKIYFQIKQREEDYIIQAFEMSHISEDIIKYNGNAFPNTNKLIDTIQYVGHHIKSIYLVKLMKTLWYIDFLSYKLRNKSITGMVYDKLAMGAAPHRYHLIRELKALKFDEIIFPDGHQGIKFIPSHKYQYMHLTDEEKTIIDKVISELKSLSTDECVEKMHQEIAFLKTKSNHSISYEYAKDLSI